MPPVQKVKTNKKAIKVKKSKPDIEDEVKSAVVSSQLEKKIKKNKKEKKKYVHTSTKGVVIIKRIPHGFFEDQLQKYFEQFGKVSRVRVARSRKTGRSKGFAFVEYTVPEVAEIAAETMNNYIMFKQNLQAVYIPPEEQKYNFFRSTVKVSDLGFTSSLKGKKFRSIKKFNEKKENLETLTKNNEKKLKYLKKKYEELGIVIDPTILSSPKSLVSVKKSPVEKVKKQESSDDEEFDSDESFEFEDIQQLDSDEDSVGEEEVVEVTKPLTKSSKRIVQKPVKETPAPAPKTKKVNKKVAAPKKTVQASDSDSPVVSKKKPANKKAIKKVVQESPVAIVKKTKPTKKDSAENLLKPKRAGIEKKKKSENNKTSKVGTDKLKFAVKKMLSGDSPKKVTKGKDALKKKSGKK